VLIVNVMNKLPFLDPQLQYEFLLHGLPKGKRFAKLYKTIVPEDLDLVKTYYDYSTEKAMEVLELHSEEDFKEMRAALSEGGVLRAKKSSKRDG
jgi:hypothetical protein